LGHIYVTVVAIAMIGAIVAAIALVIRRGRGPDKTR